MTFVDLLSAHAQSQPESVYCRFLHTGEVDGPTLTWTYADLAREAHAVAARLLADGAAGQPVLLLYPPGPEYIAGFLGCLCAGAIAVPAYPPDPSRLERTLPRLEAIVRDSGARVVLTTDAVAALAAGLGAMAPSLSALSWIATTSLPPELSAGWVRPDLPDLAFLQYTSGSTGAPKGVMVRHDNLIENSRLIQHSFGHGAGANVVSWLPAYHDMGLIGGVLQPLFVGGTLTLLSPVDFLRKPIRWLQAISHFGACTSGGPDFAYGLVTRKATEVEVGALDLSSWQTAFSGAEPVRPETVRAFLQRFASSGLRPQAMYPCYGLAESTLFVTGGDRGAEIVTREVSPDALSEGRIEGEGKTLVSCGRVRPVLEVIVVDPESRVKRAAGQIGEIWVRGGSVAAGYWGQEALSDEVFRARTTDGDGPWLRTGDLGFLEGDELYVTGRRKDLIIVHGRNVYPQDVEFSVVAAHPAIRPGCVAVFGVERDGEERVGIAAEVNPKRVDDLQEVERSILRAVAREHQLGVSGLALCPPGTLPKTSSGKLQRYAARGAYVEGSLKVLQRSSGLDLVATGAPVQESVEQSDTEWLVSWVSEATGFSEEDVDVDMPLAGFGLDSIQAVQLAEDLGQRVGRELDPAMTFDFPTLREIADALGEQPAASSVDADEIAVLPATRAAAAHPPAPVPVAPPVERVDSAPALTAGQLLTLDVAFAVLLVAVVSPALLATAVLAHGISVVVSPWATVALLPALYLVLLTAMTLTIGVVRKVLPRPSPGIHALDGAEARAWGLHFALQRVTALPLWRPVFQSMASLRFLLLRALGAEVGFALRTAMDAQILDAHLLRIDSGAMLAGGTSVSAHLMTGGRLHLAEVILEGGVELWAGAEVALGSRIGRDSTVGVRTLVLPHVRVGERARLGNFCEIGQGSRIGDGATIGDHCRIGAGAIIEAGAVLPAHSQVAAGARVAA